MGMMTTPSSHDEVQIAFENGIARGAFTKKDADGWMYMYRKDGNDYFKNIISRDYIHIPAFSGY
jgi:hypothetical protein